MIERLQQLFGIGGALNFKRDSNNFVKAAMKSSTNYQLELCLHGAQVLSWREPKGEELLFVSSHAHFQRGKPVRGGIPLIFPQFGKGQLPSHGFARNSMWEVRGSGQSEGGGVFLKLGFQDTRGTMDLWPHPFVLELKVELSDKLRMDLRVYNCGTTPFFFYTGFHTYFRVQDINRTQVLGLQQITYQDALKGEKSFFVQQPDALIVDEQLDRRYMNAPEEVRVVDQMLGRTFTVKKSNIKDLVVWNPWSDGSNSFADLGPQEYCSFICVEPMIVNQKITLEPRSGFECWQELSVS